MNRNELIRRRRLMHRRIREVVAERRLHLRPAPAPLADRPAEQVTEGAE